MMGHTHRLWAIATALAVHTHALPTALTSDWPTTVVVVAAAALVSTAPDVDQRWGLPHRTITHALLWPALVAWFVPAPFGLPVAAALASHTALDMLAGRVQALWPLPWWIGIQLVKTGGFSETVFNVLAALIFLWRQQ